MLKLRRKSRRIDSIVFGLGKFFEANKYAADSISGFGKLWGKPNIDEPIGCEDVYVRPNFIIKMFIIIVWPCYRVTTNNFAAHTMYK